jgi:hypothetical protein
VSLAKRNRDTFVPRYTLSCFLQKLFFQGMKFNTYLPK